ncbi:MAG: DUF2721 domain-containing protein [Bryobacterales bacterium]|nr:DUF2721 domain-containing protein [Bryobacterales bacterium]
MNPQDLGLAVLTGMIAPAVLISACGPLLLSTVIRFGRIVDRARGLSDRLEKLVHGKSDEEHVDEKIEIFYDQLDRLARRAKMLQRGMMSLYLALGSFIASSVAIGLAAFIGVKGVDWVPVWIGIVGTLCLLYGSLVLILESREGLDSLEIEMNFIRKIGKRQVESR